jgi:tetratricopeptide (TPR) repeat protein
VPRITPLALCSLLFAFAPSGGARAQGVPFNVTPPDMGPKYYDYFAWTTNPGTAIQLRTVEKYHLSDSFWKYYQEGDFNSAHSDLEYVLHYFPNHPRALHLLAYDKNVKLDPSLMIQHFELAIKCFPDRAFTYAQYGRYLSSIGKKSTGIQLLDEAIQMDPDLVVARAWRAELEGAQPRAGAGAPRGAAGNPRASTSSENPRQGNR